MTSSNALRLLVKSGFVVKDKWIGLISLLGVSLEERRRLKAIASSDQDDHFALEEGLQWWITNSADPSWEEFMSAIENCGDKDIAAILRRELDIKDKGNLFYKIIHILLVYCIDPNEVLRTHFADLSDAITPILTSVANVLYANGLIPFETNNDILTTKGESNLLKSSKLVGVLQRQLRAHKDPHRYLVKICHVFRNQQNQRLKEIATCMLGN